MKLSSSFKLNFFRRGQSRASSSSIPGPFEGHVVSTELEALPVLATVVGVIGGEDGDCEDNFEDLPEAFSTEVVDKFIRDIKKLSSTFCLTDANNQHSRNPVFVKNISLPLSLNGGQERAVSRDDCKILGAFIQKCTSLKTINISAANAIEQQDFKFVFKKEWNCGNKKCPLECLTLANNSLCVSSMRSLVWFLEKTPSLKSLRIINASLDNHALNILGEAINNDCIASLEELFLSKNPIGSSGLETLLSSKNALRWKGLKLSIPGEGSEKLRCLEVVTDFLRRDDVVLQRFDLSKYYTGSNVCEDGHTWDDEDWIATSFFDAIRCSSTLTYIGFDANFFNKKSISCHLNTLLCNTSDITTLVQSNHQLSIIRSINTYADPSDPILKALHINNSFNNSREKIRSKICTFLLQGNVDIKQFLHLDIFVMPSILELAATSFQKLIIHQRQECQRTNLGGREIHSTGDHFEIVSCPGKLNTVYGLMRWWNLPSLFSAKIN